MSTTSIPVDTVTVDSPTFVDTFEGPLAASDRWRAWVARNPFGAAAVAGIIATQMATLVGYYFRGIGLPQTPWPLFNGALVAPATEYGTVASYFAGQSIHMVDAVVFTILFAVLIHGRMRFLPDTPGGDIWRGIIYGASARPDQHGLPRAVRVRAEVGVRTVQLRYARRVEAAALDRPVAPHVRVPRRNAVQPGARSGPRCSIATTVQR